MGFIPNPGLLGDGSGQSRGFGNVAGAALLPRFEGLTD
jgi:hypothetical protein